MDLEYTNSRLADEFSRVYSAVFGSRKRDFGHAQSFLRIIVPLIKDAPIDLANYYSEHGNSFEGLRIAGIGQVTLGILRTILESGEEEAIRDLTHRGRYRFYQPVSEQCRTRDGRIVKKPCPAEDERERTLQRLWGLH